MAEEEFDCKKFLDEPPGKGLKGFLDGFTAGLDAMIDPFSIAMAIAQDPVGFPVDFPDLIALGPPKILLMPGIMLPDVAAKLKDLPPLPPPLSFDPSLPINMDLAMGPFNLMMGLLQIPLDLLAMSVEIPPKTPAPPLFGIDDMIGKLPGLSPIGAQNLTSCVVEIVGRVLPLKPYEPSDEDKEAAEKKKADEAAAAEA